jgi:hypothetical protein
MSGGSVVSVDTKNAEARLRRIEKKIAKEGMACCQEIAEIGRTEIQNYMPKESMESALSIGYAVVKNDNNYKEVRIVQIFPPHPEKEWNNEWFNLPFWMFESPNAIEHFEKSDGSIVEMRNVPKKLQRRFYRRVVMGLKKNEIYY